MKLKYEKYNVLMTSLVVNTGEKLGVLLSEIESIRMTLDYFVNNKKLTLNYRSYGKEQAVSGGNNEKVPSRKSDYFNLYIAATNLSYDIRTNWKELKKIYRKYLNAIIADDETNKALYFIKLLSIKSVINYKMDTYVGQLRSMQHKLLQIRQNRNPKYIPTPPYSKRYHNSYNQNFISKYVNKIMQAINRSFGIDKPRVDAIVHWEHVRQDSIDWTVGKKDLPVSGRYYTLFIKETLWSLEMPMDISHLTHELGHFVHQQVTNKDYFNPPLKRTILDIRDKLNYFLAGIEESKDEPEVEYFSDFISLVVHKEMYVISLFNKLFANDLDDFFKMDKLEDDCDEDNFYGGVPGLSFISRWVRLKSLCREFNKIYGKSKSNWIELIDSFLDDYHKTLEALMPRGFKARIRSLIIFEVNYSRIVSKHMIRLYSNRSFRLLREELRTIERNERRLFCTDKVIGPISAHINDYISKIDNIKGSQSFLPVIVGTNSTFREIISISFTTMICELTKRITHRGIISRDDKSDLFGRSLEEPIPSVRLMWYITREYFSKNNPRNSVLHPDIKKSKNPLMFNILNKHIENIPHKPKEIAFCKYRTDSNNDEIRTLRDVKNALTGRYKLDKDVFPNSYLVIGPFDMILINDDYTSKTINLYENVKNGIHAEEKRIWPPEIDIPYFASIHSVLELHRNEGRERPATKTNISGIYQIRLDYDAKYENYHKKAIMTISYMAKNYPDLAWRVYASLGWEDLILIVDNINLYDIMQLKKVLFQNKNYVRTLCQILWNGKTITRKLTTQEDVDIHIETLMRLSRDVKKIDFPAIANILRKSVNENRSKSVLESIKFIAGRFDISAKWKTNMPLSEFLLKYSLMHNDAGFLKSTTDTQTRISWESNMEY